MNRDAHSPTAGPLRNIDALIGMTEPAFGATAIEPVDCSAAERDELSELAQLARVYHLEDRAGRDAPAVPALEIDTGRLALPIARADHDGWPKIAIALTVGAILAAGVALTVRATTASTTRSNRLAVAATPAATVTRFVPTSAVPEIIVTVTAPPAAKPEQVTAAAATIPTVARSLRGDAPTHRMPAREAKPVAPAIEPPADVPDVPDVSAQSSDADTSCDDLDCILDTRSDCCEAAPTEDQSQPPSLRERPTNEELRAALAGLEHRVWTCADERGFEGLVLVRVKVAPSGAISATATAKGGTPELLACVESLIARVHLAPSARGMVGAHPFVIR